MTSTLDHTLDHGCVHCVSLPNMDCSDGPVFAVELLWTLLQAVVTSHPTSRPPPPARPPPSLHWPEIGAYLQEKDLK